MKTVKPSTQIFKQLGTEFCNFSLGQIVKVIVTCTSSLEIIIMNFFVNCLQSYAHLMSVYRAQMYALEKKEQLL